MLSLSSMAPRPRLALLVLVILLVALAVRESHDVLPPPPASLHDVPQRLREASAMTAAWWRQRGVRRRPDDLLVDVTNATLGFQEIFVLSLPARSDRRDAMALAASLSGLRFTFSAGVDGAAVEDRVLPADSAGKRILPGNKGSWRGHMNILRSIVERNLTTALILEDDIDWDVRLKAQMVSFALASRVFVQPLQGSDGGGVSAGQQHTGSAQTRDHDVPLASAAPYELPSATPYGDDWDVLWLGHCGTELPTASPTEASSLMSLLRVTLADDATVPAPASLKPHPFALPDRLGVLYAPHTRVVHAAHGTVCTQAYAVSQQGARKLLYQLGLATFTTGFDLMLGAWCDGQYRREEDDKADENENGKGNTETCLTVQPPLFSHYLTAKEDSSDIQAQGGGFLHRTGSQYIRFSVQKNLRRLVYGVTRLEDLADQWPGAEGE